MFGNAMQMSAIQFAVFINEIDVPLEFCLFYVLLLFFRYFFAILLLFH